MQLWCAKKHLLCLMKQTLVHEEATLFQNNATLVLATLVGDKTTLVLNDATLVLELLPTNRHVTHKSMKIWMNITTGSTILHT
jgi:hypothetical protein